MQTTRLLTERPFDELLCAAAAARCVGLVMLRDREGARHGVWIEAGHVVGVHVAGHFDPLLELLRRQGSLTPSLHQRCLAALPLTQERAGVVASLVAGIARSEVRAALCTQLVLRFKMLRELALSDGYDARLEPGVVPLHERSLRMPLGSLLRRAQAGQARSHVSEQALRRDEARRALRALAKRLHPDRHPLLDEAERARRERELSRATAAYHGFC